MPGVWVDVKRHRHTGRWLQNEWTRQGCRRREPALPVYVSRVVLPHPRLQLLTVFCRSDSSSTIFILSKVISVSCSSGNRLDKRVDPVISWFILFVVDFHVCVFCVSHVWWWRCVTYDAGADHFTWTSKIKKKMRWATNLSCSCVILSICSFQGSLCVF